MKETLSRLWHGDMSLKETFWVYYFAPQIMLSALGHLLGPFFGTLALLWAAYMVKPIFSSAGNYKGPKHWAILCQVFAVFMAITTLLALIV